MKDAPSSSPFSCVLIGDDSLTIACGDLLLSGGHAVRQVITRDPAVRDWAQMQGLPQGRSFVDWAEAAGEGAVDWLFSIANLRVVPASVLGCARRGGINFHDGPLPRYAGLNAPAWAIIRGETMHGVTWHLMEEGVDTGALLMQQEVPIGAMDTAFDLNTRCYAAGLESFARLLSQIENDAQRPQPQDLQARSYVGRDQRPEGGGVIDFDRPAAEIANLVRGLDFGGYWNPLGTAKLLIGGAVFHVGQASALPGDAAAGCAPGEVLEADAGQMVVATGAGRVALRGLRVAGGQDVSPADIAAPGSVIRSRAPEGWEAAAPGIAVQEPYWRAALARMEPLRLSLARAADPRKDPDWHARPLDLPKGQSIAAQAALAGLTLLRGAGVAAGDVALGLPDPLPGLGAAWGPLRLEADPAGDITPLTDATDRQLDKVRSGGGMLRDLALRDPRIAGLSCPDAAISLTGEPVAEAAVTLVFDGLHDGAPARLEADANRLNPQALEFLARRIETACKASARGATRIEDLWALPEDEAHLLRKRWNDTATDRDRGETMVSAFEDRVALQPDAPAVACGGETLTYAALNRRANRIAHVLRSMGAGPGMPVGLCLRRGIDMLAGALGILKAGAAYLPLDPAYPAARIAHFVTDSATPILLVEEALRPDLPETGAALLSVDTDPRIAAAPDDDPDRSATPQDLAYLIYTSGSTGLPKGVMVTHANVANFYTGMDDRIDHAPGDVWLAVTSLNFDISVLELFWTLSRGFKLVLAGAGSQALVGEVEAEPAKPAPGGGIDFNLFYWGNDDGVGPKKYELLLEGAKFADAHGFNAIWTPERHFHAFGGPYPNPSVTGAAVAAVTRNLEVRAGSCVAPLHHPARIAEEWAVIDNLTDGRVGLAIASGWQPDDFVLRPENTPPDNKPAMYEAIRQLRQLWRGEPVEFPTHDGTPFAVVTQPRPVSPELPIWVTTAGNPETWREAGEIGANVLTHLLGQSIEEVAGKITLYRDALRAAGHDPAQHRVTVMLHTYLAATREIAEAVAREPMKDYLRSAAGLIKQYAWAFPAFKKPQGASSPFEIDLQGLSDEEMDAILEFAFQRYFNESGLFGTVEDGLARTAQLQEIGVDEIACLIDYGIPVPKVLEGLHPLAEVLARSRQPDDAGGDASLAGLMAAHGVTHLQCTPSMAQMLLADDRTRQALSSLRYMLIGGEALPGALARSLRQATQARILNMYGPTETTIWSATHALEGDAPDIVPVGRPIANTQLYVLDAQMRPLPIGAPGELWIGGEGVTAGYWQRPELTAERFPENPFGAGRLYRTGDLAAWDAEGFLHFRGRADHQVKIRGHRIELGEIEARLAELPEVGQAVVIARDGAGGGRLIAYVTATPGFDPDAARRKLTSQLPEIMVPAVIVPLEAMPMTPNRKIDRKALPDPDTLRPEKPVLASPATPEKPTAPRAAPAPASADTIRALAEVWRGLLGVAEIRPQDSFFDLGGHSLLAVQAHREIRETLGYEGLSITDIFRLPTLAGLAGRLDQLRGGAAPAGTSAAPVATAAADAAKGEIIAKRRLMRAARDGGRG